MPNDISNNRKSYWAEKAKQARQVRMTDFELGVMVGLSTGYELRKTEVDNPRKSDKETA